MRTVYVRTGSGTFKASRPDDWESEDEIRREEFDALIAAAEKRRVEEQDSADLVPSVRELVASLAEQVASIADSVAELKKNNGNNGNGARDE